MDTVYYTDIDQHKRTRLLTTLEGDGAIVRSNRLKNNPNVILAYFRTLTGEHQATDETSTGWNWMNDLLRSESVSRCYSRA